MIMRVYRCIGVSGKDDEFRETAFATTHAWLRQQPGLVAFYAGRATAGSNSPERCMVQIWQSFDAIQRKARIRRQLARTAQTPRGNAPVD